MPVHRAAVARPHAIFLEERLAGLEVARGGGADAPPVLDVDRLLPRLDGARELAGSEAEQAVDVAVPRDRSGRPIALLDEIGGHEGRAPEELLRRRALAVSFRRSRRTHEDDAEPLSVAHDLAGGDLDREGPARGEPGLRRGAACERRRGGVVRRQEGRGRPADQRGDGMAEERLGREVGEEERPRPVDEEDGVGTRLREIAQAQLALGEGLLRQAPLAPHARLSQRALEHGDEAGHRSVRDAVARPRAQGPHHPVLVETVGDDEERNVGVGVLQDRERVERVQPGCRQIREDDVGRGPGECTHEGLSRGDAIDGRREAAAAEGVRQQVGDGRTVVHQQDSNRNAHVGCGQL